MATHRYTNRLIHEKSPYLLQHSHNPVDWYPWGDEAFKAAAAQDKPIFLSIGYATCHWCHVMEEECFEDEAIASMMNQAFINIKVDREELPEVDSLYMEFAQSMMTGAAGWPLNVLLTPELKPFFAATYLPAHGGHGLMGMDELVARINDLWRGDERDKLLEQASRIVEVFGESLKTAGDELPGSESIENAAEIFFKLADSTYGGLKGIPKFPIGYQALFLLGCYRYLQEGRSLFLVERTLTMMHQGGIYDHLGGGFSRYSVDERWLVPHFEKMLYDNAILLFSYLETWRATNNPLFKNVCEEIAGYLLRDMTHPDGGFYSAEDADSDGREGYFYTWTLQEIEQILGKEEAQLFARIYGVTEEGNFEGRNILHTSLSLEEVAVRSHMQVEQLELLLKRMRLKLWEEREKRNHPFKDDKILSGWNGLMIHALAEAGNACEEHSWLEAARKCAGFLKMHLWEQGRLFRRWRDGEARFAAGLDEYAFLIKGLLTLYEATMETEWLEWSIELTMLLNEKFKAGEGGAFYQTDATDETLILRKCQFADGAEPSGNAIHGENLVRLYAMTGEAQYRTQAEDILKAVKKYIDNYPMGYCYHLITLQRYYNRRAPLLVIALNESQHFATEIRKAIYSRFIPHRSIIWRRHDDAQLFSLIPRVREQPPLDNQTTLYICYEGRCQKPLNDQQEILAAIHNL